MKPNEETRAMHPDDVLVAIGHHMQRGRRGFNYRSDSFYTFFFQNRKEYPLILGRIMFDWNGPFPTSEDLYQAKTNLVCSGMLNFSLNSPSYYQFDSAVDLSYKKYISKRISPEQERGLVELAKKFEEEFGAEEIN